MQVVSKGEFARLCNVTPARVSQWLAAGQISGEALLGTGRNAQIVVEKAQEQLRLRLNIDQRHSGNGLATRLGEVASPAQAAPGSSPGGLDQQLLEERLIKARRENREKDRDEALSNGRLVDADEARRATAKEIAQVIARLDGAMPEIAAALAAKFQIPQRDIVHVMRAELRKVRAAGAIEARERAEPMPETVGFDINPDSEC